MKRFLLTLFFAMTAATQYAQECELEECCNSWFNSDNLSVEGKVGFFIPLSSQFRDIYSSVECLWEAEVNYQLYDCLAAWTSVSYITDTGRSTGLSYKTKFSLLPIGFGLKYCFPSECVSYYLGGGLQYSQLRTTDDSPFVIRKVNHWDWGVLAKAGALVPLTEQFFLDFFAEYSYLMMSFRKTNDGAVVRHKANLSSVNFGIGIGYHL